MVIDLHLPLPSSLPEIHQVEVGYSGCTRRNKGSGREVTVT